MPVKQLYWRRYIFIILNNNFVKYNTLTKRNTSKHIFSTYLQIWGIGGKTGFFTHTDVPMMYEINKKVFVIDFPGSNSLDYHAKTFSICGAMNNLIIVVIPFTGDVNQLVSEELARVFSVIKGSDATKVIFFGIQT